MILSLRDLAHAADHLQQPEEAWNHALATVPMLSGPDHDARRRDAYEAFLLRRAEIFVGLPSRFDALAVGWHRAAVRLFGERAEEALDATVALFGGRLGWSGVDDAERALLRAVSRQDARKEPVT